MRSMKDYPFSFGGGRSARALGALAAFAMINIFSLAAAFGAVAPDWRITPGVVCTKSDPDFNDYDYPEQIARCKRHVTVEMKLVVAENYGDIPRSQWNRYEFDHLYPLCAGGSNDIGNLWPQPLAQAKKKDVLEHEICLGLREGTLTQAEALRRVRVWFEAVMAHKLAP